MRNKPAYCPQCGSGVQRAGIQPGWECCKSTCLWCITDSDLSGDVAQDECTCLVNRRQVSNIKRCFYCAQLKGPYVHDTPVHPDEHPVLAGHRVERERVRELVGSFKKHEGTDLAPVMPEIPGWTCEREAAGRCHEYTATMFSERHTVRVLDSEVERLGTFQAVAEAAFNMLGSVLEDNEARQPAGTGRSEYIKRKLRERGPRVTVEPDVPLEHWKEWK